LPKEFMNVTINAGLKNNFSEGLGVEYITFTGNTYREALDQLYKKGTELNILSQMQIIRKYPDERKGFLGIRKRQQYNILVAVMDNKFTSNKKKRETSNLSTPPLFPYEENLANREKPSFPVKDISADKEPRSFRKAEPNWDKLTVENAKLKEDLNELKDSITHIENLIKENFIQGQVRTGIDKEKQVYEDIEISQKNIKWAENYLRDKEFSNVLINNICEELKSQKRDVLVEKPRILSFIREFLRNSLPSEDISLESYNFGDTILFAGPTGVGKTVSIIKMAAHIAAMRKKSMRFVSVDKYKIGAASQLIDYAEILKSPFYPISKPEDFFDIINKDEAHYTFIDTAGRSPRETIHIKELAEWVSKSDKKIDIHLVVSATTKPGDLDFIMDNYGVLDFSHILATKLDETVSYGSILSTLYKTKKPLSFITNGQAVPQDFEISNLDKIISDTIK